ncbi:class E sortase [Streptomyces pathocidini]|uniref:class E sortase n=2 Tax=Streptomyces pathocidini TaxID=1650571 RepID=UPI0033D4D5CB
MTALRPERDTTSPYGDPYGGADAFEAAVGRLDDPLNDPLPGQEPAPAAPEPPPAYGAHETYEPRAGYETYAENYGYGYGEAPQGAAGQAPVQETTGQPPVQETAYEPAYGTPYEPAALYEPAAPYETPGLGIPGPEPCEPPAAPVAGAEDHGHPGGADSETMALRVPEAERRDGEPDQVPGGRAARRKAAKQAGRPARLKQAARATAPATTAAAGAGTPQSPPLSRVEARRQARARKDPPGVIASRIVGEAFITIGVLMLLFVTYQLWYTNVLAHQEAGGAANNLHKQWDEGGAEDRQAGAFEPGQGFAILYIPKLDVKVPIAEGIDKASVLDRGLVGHYGEGKLKTAMPWDKKGNFALAGHRNTHGEPFRYVNRLKPGDQIVVETRSAFYTYEMASILPQTSPSNISVIEPVPQGSGFTAPGRYITLTTCTPEFTSTYRMIVWGKMVDERPRSEGKPDALVGG